MGAEILPALADLTWSMSKWSTSQMPCQFQRNGYHTKMHWASATKPRSNWQFSRMLSAHSMGMWKGIMCELNDCIIHKPGVTTCLYAVIQLFSNVKLSRTLEGISPFSFSRQQGGQGSAAGVRCPLSTVGCLPTQLLEHFKNSCGGNKVIPD